MYTQLVQIYNDLVFGGLGRKGPLPGISVVQRKLENQYEVTYQTFSCTQ